MKRQDLAYGALLALLTAVFFWPLLSLKNVWYQDDFAPEIMPFFHWLHQVYERGALPLWCNADQCGYPMFDEGRTGLLYAPFRFVATHFDYAAGVLAYFSAHVLWCAWGAYTFLRFKGLRAEAALLGAVMAAFGGGMVTPLHHWITVVSLAWFPWVLLAYSLCLEVSPARRQAGAALLGLSLGLVVLGGHLGIVIYELMALAVLHAWQLAKKGKGAWLALGAAALVAALLCGGQLWATRNYTLQSVRSSAFDYALAAENSMSPASLLQLPLPYLFGDNNDASFLGRSWPLGTWLQQGMLAYVAFLGLALAWLGFRRERRKALPFAAAAVLMLWYALGSWGGLHWLLFHLPAFGHLRAPMKAAWLAPMLLSYPAALGLEGLLEHKDEQKRLFSLMAWVVLGLFAAALALFALRGTLEAQGLKYIGAHVAGKDGHLADLSYYAVKLQRWLMRLQRHLAEEGAWSLMALGLIWSGLRNRSASSFPALLLALAFFGQLCWQGSRYQPVISRDYFDKPPATALQLRALVGARPSPSRICGWGWGDLMVRSFPQGRFAGDYENERRVAEVIGGNAGFLYGLDSVRGYTPVGLSRVAALLGDAIDYAARVPAPQMAADLLKHRESLDDAGVRYIAASMPLQAPGLRLLSRAPLNLYENLRAKELARAEGAAIRWLEYGDEGWELEVDMKKPGRLELARSFYAGGQLGWVDGKAAEILPSGAAWCAFDLPAGRHRVAIAPDSGPYRLALKLQRLGFALALLLLAAAYLKSQRSALAD